MRTIYESKSNSETNSKKPKLNIASPPIASRLSRPEPVFARLRRPPTTCNSHQSHPELLMDMDTDIVSASQSAGPTLKKGKFSYPTVCVVCRVGVGYYLFIVDLNDDDVSGGGFIESFPKIRVADFGRSTFFVDESTLYVFDSSASICPGVVNSHCNSVYSYVLPENILEIEDFILDKRMVNKAPPLRCKKFYPRTIRYGRLVLVFSTIIRFYDDTEVDANQVDFELYDLGRGNMSRNLPALSVLRNRDGVSDGHIFSYELCDTETGSSVAFTGNYMPSQAFYFTIRGFGLVDDTQTFVVRTDMGHAFKLDLQSPTAAWELYTDGWIMGDHDSPFFVIGEQCVDAFGAYNLKMQDLDTKFELWRSNVAAIEQRAFRLDDDYDDFVEEKRRSMFKSEGGDPHILKRVNEIDRRVRFPLSSFDSSLAFESGVDFTLVDNYASTVQIGMDPSTNYPHMVIDLFNVDFLKFPKLDFSMVLEDQQYELLKHGWVKRLKTFKFVVNEECIPIRLRDVFPVGI